MHVESLRYQMLYQQATCIIAIKPFHLNKKIVTFQLTAMPIFIRFLYVCVCVLLISSLSPSLSLLAYGRGLTCARNSNISLHIGLFPPLTHI